jgi:hypothetical protein
MKRIAVVAALLAAAPAAHAGPLGGVVKHVFKKLAQKKGDRVFHADGAAYHGTFTGTDGQVKPAIVRVSRGGAGKPGKPDILGVAVKYEGKSGTQDLLMVTSKEARGWKARVPRFATSLAGASISSLLGFKSKGQRGALTAELPAEMTTLADATPRAIEGKQRFGVNLVRGGFLLRKQVVAPQGTVEIDFDRPISAEQAATLHFNPFNAGDGIAPRLVPNWARSYAYPGSQKGRGLAVE